MRYTPVRCYVLLDLVDQGKLVIERNGAQEPSIAGYGLISATHPFSQRRLLTAVEDLRKAGMISFAEKTDFGVYVGKAEVAPVGRNRLHMARQAQQEFAELAERQAAERKAFEQKRAEELAAFAEANQVEAPARTPQQEAAERVRAFLNRHAERNVVEKEIIFQVDDHTLRASDLLALCNAVLGAR